MMTGRWNRGFCGLHVFLFITFFTAIASASILSRFDLIFTRNIRGRYNESAWFRQKKLHLIGGGHNTDDEDASPPTREEEIFEFYESVNGTTAQQYYEEEPSIDQSSPKQRKKGTQQHTSDMLLDLLSRPVKNEESLELRQLIKHRASEYVSNLRECSKEGDKLPLPRKVLHFLATKIPAIRNSPDVNLRIQTARSHIDSGVAASLIGTIAQISGLYDKESIQTTTTTKKTSQKQQKDGGGPYRSVSRDIITDRRFQQLIETVLCGLDVAKRKRENIRHKLGAEKNQTSDIEEIIAEEHVKVDDGLDVRDACRAAWGIALLGAHQKESGAVDQKVMDLLMALSLRTRELLLAGLQRTIQGDLYQEFGDTARTTEELLSEASEELAEDAASAMWTFACVRACTEMRSAPLFETCCSILCQDPVDMRRRAQSMEPSLGNENIGTSDVVDRLARSEAEIIAEETNHDYDDDKENLQNVNKHNIDVGVAASSIEDNDALLDWLSPNVLTDILWALALHGSSNKKLSKDEISLSETADALREIVTDRLVEWLSDDHHFLSQSSNNSRNNKRKETETMTVEVVDAAALIQSEKVAKDNTVEMNGDGNASDDEEEKESTVQEVEVVDAAMLLESTPDSVETETVVASTVTIGDHEQTESVETSFNGDESNFDDPPSGQAMDAINDSLTNQCDSLRHKLSRIHFSPHDLCSIAWAVTEFGDSLQFQIVEFVIASFIHLGKRSTKKLGGADLSNLAWAVAKHTVDEGKWSEDIFDSRLFLLIEWIADRALKMSDGVAEENEFSTARMLSAFQPPELGRLAWAVTRVALMNADLSSDEDDVGYDAIRELPKAALIAAASDLSIFGTEDLVRIAWAYLELCDIDKVLADPVMVSALGRILATIETSLIRWERGHCTLKDKEESGDINEMIRFGSFFGRKRVLYEPLLDEPFEEDDDFEDDEQMPTPKKVKAHLPLLRDLSVDPANLCKVACGFARLEQKQTELKGSSTLTRVAVRLLILKKGRLLRECTMFDLVRASEAVANQNTLGYGHNLAIGQFTRRVVNLLNLALHNCDEDNPDPHLHLSVASPNDIATLIWSLGELGVRHSIFADDPLTAHRRLRLVSESPLVTKNQLALLSKDSTLRLLRGLISMKVMFSDKQTLVEVLSQISSNISSINDEQYLIEIVELVATLKEEIGFEDVKKSNADSPPGILVSKMNDLDLNKTNSREVLEGEESGGLRKDNCTIQLLKLSDHVLRAVAAKSAALVHTWSAHSLRRLLVVYSLLPFRADELIDAIDRQVSKQKSILHSTTLRASFRSLFRQAAIDAMMVKRELSSKTSEESGLTATLKNGLKVIFKKSGNKDDDDDSQIDEQDEAVKVQDLLIRSILSLSAVSSSVKQIASTSASSPDTVLQRIAEGAYFEIGRCDELIANYQRIEFSTGRRRSRYNEQVRRDISKRLLSRLFP